MLKKTLVALAVASGVALGSVGPLAEPAAAAPMHHKHHHNWHPHKKRVCHIVWHRKHVWRHHHWVWIKVPVKHCHWGWGPHW
jgi:hypothetical protein